MIAFFIALLAAGLGLVAGFIHPLAPIAVLIGGAVIALALSGPFALLMAFMAVLFLRPGDFIPELASLEPAKLMAAGTLVFFVSAKLIRRDHGLAMSPANRWLMLLAVGVLVSCLFSTDRDASIAYYLSTFIKIIAAWIMILNVIDTKKRAVALQVGTAVLTAILGGYAIWAKVNQHDLVEETRAVFVGVLADPNDLAFTLLVALPFTFEAFRRVRGSQRWFYLLCGALAVGGIIASQSRGGLIGLGVCVFFWMRTLGMSRTVGVALTAALCGFIFVYGGIAERRTASESPFDVDTSSQGRLDAWQAGLRMFRHNPVFGVGMDQASSQFAAYAIDPLSWRPKTSHNLFVQAAAETGLMGFVPFMMLLAFAYKATKRLRDMEPPPGASPLEMAYLRSLHPCLMGALAAGFFLSMAWSWFLYLLLAQAAVSERHWL